VCLPGAVSWVQSIRGGPVGLAWLVQVADARDA
jgi:hypothetical protein